MTIIASVFYDLLYYNSIHMLFTAISALFIFIFTSTRLKSFSFGLMRKPVQFLASISFPLYLIHQNIGYYILKSAELIGIKTEWAIMIPITICLLIATLVHYSVEQPVSKLMKRISVK